MSVIITKIDKSSPLISRRISAGDTLISINGHEITDVLDYQFRMQEPVLSLLFLRADNTRRLVKLRNNDGLDLGLHFGSYLMDAQRGCRNNCVFCFIDQLPKGLRSSLYFKDDDSRLSFLFGNYITLTNLSEHEINRIIEMKINPVNISVHTTNPDLRTGMMGNKNAGDALKIMERLAAAGVSINCQIVLCPGLNDKDELTRSLSDLQKLYPAVSSISVVPVGLTRHRDGLYPLTGFDRKSALDALRQIEGVSAANLSEIGTRLVYPADEFFLKAGVPLPGYDYYEDFPQIENGVGMCRFFCDKFMDELDKMTEQNLNRHVSIATGEMAAPMISELTGRLSRKVRGLRIDVYAIHNDFFGSDITVSGLITGGDILNQLSGMDLGEYLMIPKNMLKSGEDVFLDDMTLSELETALSVKIIPSDGGTELCRLLTERKGDKAD